MALLFRSLLRFDQDGSHPEDAVRHLTDWVMEQFDITLSDGAGNSDHCRATLRRVAGQSVEIIEFRLSYDERDSVTTATLIYTSSGSWMLVEDEIGMLGAFEAALPQVVPSVLVELMAWCCPSVSGVGLVPEPQDLVPTHIASLPALLADEGSVPVVVAVSNDEEPGSSDPRLRTELSSDLTGRACVFDGTP